MKVDTATELNVNAVNDVFRRALRMSVGKAAVVLLAICAASIVVMMSTGASLVTTLWYTLSGALVVGLLIRHDMKRLLKNEFVIMPRERVMIECDQESFRIAVGTNSWQFPFRAVRRGEYCGDEGEGRYSSVLRIDVGAREELIVPLEADGFKCLSDWVRANRPHTWR